MTSCIAFALAAVAGGGCPHPGAVPEGWWDAGEAASSGPADGGRRDVAWNDTGAPGDAPRVDLSDTDDGADLDATPSPDRTTGDGNAGDGARSDLGAGVDGGGNRDAARRDLGQTHARDWVRPEQHGRAVLQGSQDCTLCHGADLTGSGTAPSCDRCHDLIDPDWRSGCVFCHGGTDNTSGAPPRDLSGHTDASASGVGAHSAHLESTTHRAVACSECHVVPAMLTSAEHLFDSTPGQAEVRLGGLGQGGTFDGTGCSALSCHGDGQTAGAVASFTDHISTCTACHAGSASSAAEQEAMSGHHARHLGRGATCAECHAAVLDDAGSFVNAALHVNGAKDVAVRSGAYDGATHDCASSCHLVAGSRNWLADFAHPDGWTQPANHGAALLGGAQDCRACHGQDLRGGSSGIGCDLCHDGGSDWGADCTFCHGGTDSSSGAPPVDLDGAVEPSLRSVGAHTEHLQGADHAAVACGSCHQVPAAYLADGHLFDSTPGRAEIVLAQAGASYDPATGTCTTACHGDGVSAGTSPAYEDGADLGCASCHGQPNPWPHPQISVCAMCHASVIELDGQISAPGLHVNGTVDRTRYHRSDFALDSVHPDFYYSNPDGCRTCHGADLTGGGATGQIPSCDNCHGMP